MTPREAVLQDENDRLKMENDYLRRALDPSVIDSREAVANWMIKHSFATGHGDTLADLLEELSGQIAKLRAKPPN